MERDLHEPARAQEEDLVAATTEHRLKMALWAVPIIFSCGGFWALMTSTSSQLTHEVAEVQVELQEHTKLKAHPVTYSRL